MALGAAAEPVGGRVGRVELARGEVRRRRAAASSGAAAALSGRPLASARSSDVAGQRRLAPGQVDGRQRPRRLGVADVEAVEQLLGLLEAALADPQVGQPDERPGPQRARGPAPTAGRPR